MKQRIAQGKDIPEDYLKYTGRKTVIILSLEFIS